ncbi:MAG: ferritin-like domain-containing protein [Gaiellaceae bacterium]
MSDLLTLEEVDRDGAIRESMDRVADGSRAGFLKKSMLATGGIVGGGALLAAMADPAQAATANDVSILNFALTLEYLEAEFYTEAVAMGALSGEVLDFARIVAAHERAHVSFLKKALGTAAVPKPSFNFRGTTENQAKFKATAQVLEDTGVMAYAGQAPLIDANAILAAALSVHSIEARHAAWIRHINGAAPAPVAFDKPKTKQQILTAVAGTQFITGTPTMTTSGGSPAFTG